MREMISKSFAWLGCSKIWMLRAKSKELGVLLELKTLRLYKNLRL